MAVSPACALVNRRMSTAVGFDQMHFAPRLDSSSTAFAKWSYILQRANIRRRRINESDAIDICRLRLLGWYQHDIAALYGMNQGCVCRIVNGKRFPRAMIIARLSMIF